MIIFFIYTLKYDSSGGGTISKIDHLSDTITLGINSYNNWFLGKTDNVNDLYLLSDHNPIIITANNAKGFEFLGKNKFNFININTDLPDYRDFTVEELSNKLSMEKIFEKLKVRKIIENNVGDELDQIADLSKMIDILFDIVFKILSQKSLDKEKLLADKHFKDISDGLVIPRYSNILDRDKAFDEYSIRYRKLLEVMRINNYNI